MVAKVGVCCLADDVIYSVEHLTELQHATAGHAGHGLQISAIANYISFAPLEAGAVGRQYSHSICQPVQVVTYNFDCDVHDEKSM